MIRVAVIGAGQWGPNLVRNFHDRESSEVVCVVDRDPGRLNLLRARFPDVQVEEQAERAIADPSVDAVVIVTPTSTHHSLARAALLQGKHVLVEKPLTNDVTHAEELCALAREKSRVLMCGHVFLFNAGVQRVKSLLEAGELGRIHYLAMVRTNLGPIRMDVNAAWDLAAHDISIANFWLGAAPLTVSAVGESWINPSVEDAVFATLRYADGVLVNLHVSWLNPRKVRDITIVGERRMLTFDDMSPTEPLRLYDKQVTNELTESQYVDTFKSFRAGIREGDITIPKVPFWEPLKAECDHFLTCVAEGKRPLVGGEEALQVVRTLAAMERSVRRRGAEEQVQ